MDTVSPIDREDARFEVPTKLGGPPTYLGGAEAGKERTIFAAVIGQSTQALCQYYHKVGVTYQFERRPSFDSLGEDAFECDRVRLRRS